ncbi:MAG: helix-turn-helix domain-containing protein [Bacteroidales bacterium]|jgi:transcriptional regulator with XRE-family HTH domain|nr:helix-turn-helix domain-containing protein [Bacteroidales bacterium]
MLLSEKLKEIRLQSQLPQRKIASELDIDTATYCKYEKGLMKMSKPQVLKFAQFLNANEEELLTLWLADQIYNVVKDEEHADKALNIVAKKL